MTTATESACIFLADALNAGPRDAAEILAAAEGANISERTMQRAAEQMGVIKAKAGFDGGWNWALPAEGAKAESGFQGEDTAGGMSNHVKVSSRVEPEPSRAAIIAARLRKLEAARGMKGPFYPQDSRIQAWVLAGISDPDLKEAHERAVSDCKGMLTVGIMDKYVNEVIHEGAKA